MLDGTDSRIDLSPHPPNRSIISTLTDTESCAGPVSLSVQFLPNISVYAPPNQSVPSTPTDISSCATTTSMSVQVLPNLSVFPSRNSDSADRRPGFSVCPGGGGGWFFYLPPPSRTSHSATLLYLSLLIGGVVVDTSDPSRTPDSDVSIRPGGEGWF